MGNQKSAFYTDSIEESIKFLGDCTIKLITVQTWMAMWHHMSARNMETTTYWTSWHVKKLRQV